MSAVYEPPCQLGIKCTDRDRERGRDSLHRETCPMSPAMISRRQGRINALTLAEMRSALTFLSGWTPTGTDCALHDADVLRRCPECETDPPGHTAQCTLRPGAEPLAAIVKEPTS